MRHSETRATYFFHQLLNLVWVSTVDRGGQASQTQNSDWLANGFNCMAKSLNLLNYIFEHVKLNDFKDNLHGKILKQ